MKRYLLLLFVPLFLPACATPSLKPGMILQYTEPSVDYEKAPDVDFDRLQTFTFHPISKESHNNESLWSPIIEKQLQFMIRNNLEMLGYKYVENPFVDFYVSVYYSNEYQSTYVPPSTYTTLRYIPGRTQTTYMNFYGDVSGGGTATTTTPGYYVPQTVTRSGYEVGSFFPFVGVTAYEFRDGNLEQIWKGTAIVSTPESNIRLSSQVLLSQLLSLKNFPPSAGQGRLDDNHSFDGVIGIVPVVQTYNGNDFYPVIALIAKPSAAYEAGLKPLDVIRKVDDKDTLNKSWAEVKNLMKRNQGEPISFCIERNGEMSYSKFIVESKSDDKNRWKEILYLDNQYRIKKNKIPKDMIANIGSMPKQN